MKTLILVVAMTLLAGCASAPNAIQPSYVSARFYADMTCTDLVEESKAVQSNLAAVERRITKQNNANATAAVVGALVFWPALFFIRGDSTDATEYANLQGQAETISNAGREKHCEGIAISPSEVLAETCKVAKEKYKATSPRKHKDIELRKELGNEIRKNCAKRNGKYS